MNMEAKFADLEVGYDVPALPGMREDQIQTPCLILDLDALERNIRKMGDYARAHKMQHRAHGKMHKSVEVANEVRPIRAGARWCRTATWYQVPAPSVGRPLPGPWPSGWRQFNCLPTSISASRATDHGRDA